MRRKRPVDLGKRRTREHVLADLSINYVERQILMAGFTLQEVQRDYGLDLAMYSFNSRGEAEPGQTLFQVKATDASPLRNDGQQVAFRVAWRDLNRWAGELMPTILVVYHAPSDIAYWLYVQAHVGEKNIRRVGRAVTTTLVWSAQDVLDVAAVRRMVRFKSSIFAQSRKVRHSYDE